MKLELIAIKTENGRYYICEKQSIERRYYKSSLSNFMINGKYPLPSFSENWHYVESKPEKITKMKKKPDINHRYELADKDLISDKMPEFLNIDDGRIEKYASLYEKTSDSQDDIEINCPFDLEIILTVDEIINPVEMSYKIGNGKAIDQDSISHQLADKVIFPPIVLPQKPCKLSSHQSYEIVRQYIKDHIDPKVSTITSDYDFCFTVKKRIKLAKPHHFTVDVNAFSQRKRKPKLVKKTQSDRLDTCFEMTHSPYNYKDYTPIKEFQGNNHHELKEKIDNYCQSLIEFINTPLIECECCEGNGIIKQGKI